VSTLRPGMDLSGLSTSDLLHCYGLEDHSLGGTDEQRPLELPFFCLAKSAEVQHLSRRESFCLKNQGPRLLAFPSSPLFPCHNGTDFLVEKFSPEDEVPLRYLLLLPVMPWSPPPPPPHPPLTREDASNMSRQSSPVP